jgi:NAD+ synthase (glutamine-hydrolysing)
LLSLAKATLNTGTTLMVGLPLAFSNRLYNCAAFLNNGHILAIVPKSNLPTYSEFYENRWYATWEGSNVPISIGERQTLFGTNILVQIGDTLVGAEICEDLWASSSPHIALAQKGATIIANLSASPEQVGKATDRRNLVTSASYKQYCAYIYAGCGWTESTSEVVMGGHRIHAVGGKVVAECEPFGNDHQLLISDIDTGQILSDRRKCKFPVVSGADIVKVSMSAPTKRPFYCHVDKNPFLPNEGGAERQQRLSTAINIMTHGLARRLSSTPSKKVALGVSGGLDSTLALLIACEAFDRLGLPRKDINALILPGMASSDRTQSNAVKLAEALSTTSVEVPIAEIARAKLLRHGHDGVTQDLGYENAQALQRTDELYTFCAIHGCLPLGTGDLSELALGWCTYGADQNNGGYNTNAGVPKTMVKALVEYLASTSECAGTEETLLDILATPISPELTKGDSAEITQSTEELIGPYELNDFFLYWHFKGQSKERIEQLAYLAFKDEYNYVTVSDWLDRFVTRFQQSQYKRQNLPDSPIVGTVSLSPRGCWRAPADPGL